MRVYICITHMCLNSYVSCLCTRMYCMCLFVHHLCSPMYISTAYTNVWLSRACVCLPASTICVYIDRACVLSYNLCLWLDTSGIVCARVLHTNCTPTLCTPATYYLATGDIMESPSNSMWPSTHPNVISGENKNMGKSQTGLEYVRSNGVQRGLWMFEATRDLDTQ